MIDNETKEFYIDERYWCKSCGSHSHKCDVKTGCCFECGADDWEVEVDKLDEII